MGDVIPKDLPHHVNLVSGQKAFFAFYVALANALRINDNDRVKELMIFSLSTTVRLFLGMDSSTMLLEINGVNNHMKSLGNLCEDSWLTWSLRAQDFAVLHNVRLSGSDKCASSLNKLGLNYLGQPLNKNHAHTLGLQSQMLCDEAIEVLRAMDRLYNSRPLTKDYTKLLRLLKAVQGQATVAGKTTFVATDAVTYVISFIFVELLRGSIDANFLTVAALDPLSKPGFVSLLLTRQRVLQYLNSLVSVMEDSKAKTEMQTVMTDIFLEPERWNNTFPSEHATETHEETEAGPIGTASGGSTEQSNTQGSALDGFLAKLQHASSKKLAQLAHGVNSGDYDKGLVLVASDSKLEEVLNDGERVKKEPQLQSLNTHLRAFEALLETARAVSCSGQISITGFVVHQVVFIQNSVHPALAFNIPSEVNVHRSQGPNHEPQGVGAVN